MIACSSAFNGGADDDRNEMTSRVGNNMFSGYASRPQFTTCGQQRVRLSNGIRTRAYIWPLTSCSQDNVTLLPSYTPVKNRPTSGVCRSRRLRSELDRLNLLRRQPQTDATVLDRRWLLSFLEKIQRERRGDRSVERQDDIRQFISRIEHTNDRARAI